MRIARKRRDALVHVVVPLIDVRRRRVHCHRVRAADIVSLGCACDGPFVAPGPVSRSPSRLLLMVVLDAMRFKRRIRPLIPAARVRHCALTIEPANPHQPSARRLRPFVAVHLGTPGPETRRRRRLLDTLLPEQVRTTPMPENQHVSEFVSFFREMEQSQRAREERIGQYAKPHLESGVLPTPDDVRDAINSLVGDARRKVLRHHAFWKERSLRKGLESLVHAAHRAYMDICRHDAALGALADSRDLQDQVDHAVGYAAQKDVVAYCALAQGVRDTLVKIRRLRSDIADDLSGIEGRMFRMDISQFVRELRNNVLHGRVLVPQWSVSFLHESQRCTGSMRYSKEELTETGDWKAQSLRFIRSSSGEQVRLTVVVQEHFTLLNDLRSKLEGLFARNTSPAEQDYWNIEDAHKRGLRRQWAKILVGQVGKGKDPYDHLHRFFEPEVLREILRYPRNSKEQVDFIIALKSGEIDCDDELREVMYRAFGVAHDSAR